MSGTWLEVGTRLFTSVAAFHTASVVRRKTELVPEFFTVPEVFEDGNRLLCGTDAVGPVVLPPWCANASSPSRAFVASTRAALESPEATRGLPRWIDLVFGVDRKSVARRNVFSA